MSTVYGKPGNDSLNGSLKADEIYGFAGNDVLDGREGNDVLYGGEGDDTYLIRQNSGSDIIENYDKNAGFDVVRFVDVLPKNITKAIRDIAHGDLTLVYGKSQLKISYYFTDAKHQIDQFVFSDKTVWNTISKALADKLAPVQGTSGNDNIMGVFDWSETIDGLSGDDKINGAGGDDTLLGGSGNDLITGGEGNDLIKGGQGSDQLYGEQGRDSLIGDAGSDLLYGGDGPDALEGGEGDDQLFGGNGDDKLMGDAGSDYLDGNAGNDILIGGAGKDTLLGGEGNDTYYINDLQNIVYDASGNDTVYVSVDDYKIPDGIEKVIFAKDVRSLPYFVDDLLSGGVQLGVGQPHTFSYSFVSTPQPTLKGFSPYSTEQQQAVRDALAKYSAIAGVTFVEKNDQANIDLRFFRDDLSQFGFQNMGGFGSYPPDSDIHINVQTQDMSLAHGKANGNFGTLLHEIGHAVGMKHLFEKPILGGSEDNTDNSVMSYKFGRQYAVDLGLFDKAAIHYLYGVNHSIRAGNDTYDMNDRYIWDGAGTDTLDVSAQTLSVNIDLRPGSWNYAGTKATSILAPNQFFIGFGTVIENANTGSGDDILRGNDKRNIMDGGAGNDTLFGGVGNDKLIGGKGSDVLVGGLGTDTYVLSEAKPAHDIVRIAAGDSSLSEYDKVSGFKLAATVAHSALDQLDLPSSHIVADVAKSNGINAGNIASHHISHGLITFDDNNYYTQAFTVNQSNLAHVLNYLKANFHQVGDTLVFNAMGNSYVFQEGGNNDTLIELTGTVSSGLSNDGILSGSVWLT